MRGDGGGENEAKEKRLGTNWLNLLPYTFGIKIAAGKGKKWAGKKNWRIKKGKTNWQTKKGETNWLNLLPY